MPSSYGKTTEFGSFGYSNWFVNFSIILNRKVVIEIQLDTFSGRQYTRANAHRRTHVHGPCGSSRSFPTRILATCTRTLKSLLSTVQRRITRRAIFPKLWRSARARSALVCDRWDESPRDTIFNAPSRTEETLSHPLAILHPSTSSIYLVCTCGNYQTSTHTLLLSLLLLLYFQTHTSCLCATICSFPLSTGVLWLRVSRSVRGDTRIFSFCFFPRDDRASPRYHLPPTDPTIFIHWPGGLSYQTPTDRTETDEQ